MKGKCPSKQDGNNQRMYSEKERRCPPPNTLLTRANMANPNTLNTYSMQSHGSRGRCNEQTVSGGDTPDNRIIDVGKAHTIIKFQYETYTLQVEIQVYYRTQQVFSTGCVGANGAVNVALDENDSTIRVNVIPDCAGGSGTAWYYTIECPGDLICDDDLCYCGLSRSISSQEIPTTYNGCGAEGDNFNWLIASIGDVWKFTPAYNSHDLCYGGCNNHKTTCDSNFLRDMMASCFANFGLIPIVCNNYISYALLYYEAVANFGYAPFTEAQKDDCGCL